MKNSKYIFLIMGKWDQYEHILAALSSNMFEE